MFRCLNTAFTSVFTYVVAIVFFWMKIYCWPEATKT